MQDKENASCAKCDDTGFLDYRGFSMTACPWCNSTVKENLTVGSGVKDCLTTEPVSNRYKFDDGEIHLCWACGALPCDGGLQSWEKLPWIVTLKESGGWRFLIDSRYPDDPDMFSGFKISNHGKIMAQPTLTTGSGGRLNLHRSYFMEDLPA